MEEMYYVDHAAKAGTGKTAAQDLHRIEESLACSHIISRGFRFEGSFEKLLNPADDLDKVVFDPAVRSRTDRFVQLYRKP